MSISTLERNSCVLVIETDETLATQVSLDLQASGYEAVIARDADSGIANLRDRHPALIVIDRMLAGESGLNLCNYLRKSGAREPMLVLMARDTVDDRVACLESGADDYFLKPYNW